METIFKYDDSDPQLMYYSLGSENALDSISSEMIRCSRKELTVLLPMHFVMQNGVLERIEYSTAGMKPLNSYLEKFAINKKRFADIAGRILDALEECSYHMIPETQIFLELDSLYIDIATMKICLLCVPVKQITKPYDLKQFFSSFIESIYLDVDSGHESDAFQRMYDMLPGQDLTIEKMRENLDILLHGVVKDATASEQPAASESIRKDKSFDIRSALVDVVQENAVSMPAAAAGKPDKKNSLLKSLGSHTQKEDKKSKKSSAPSDLMSMFRKAQNNAEPVSQQMLHQEANRSAAEPVKTSSNSGRTVLILHDDPDQTAYLIYGSNKIRIDAEGTVIGRLGGNAGRKVDIYLDSVHVSSCHAVISYDFENMKYTVTDHSSTGTVLNGSRIQKSVPAELHHNDMLVFGDVPCRILLEDNTNS